MERVKEREGEKEKKGGRVREERAGGRGGGGEMDRWKWRRERWRGFMCSPFGATPIGSQGVLGRTVRRFAASRTFLEVSSDGAVAFSDPRSAQSWQDFHRVDETVGPEDDHREDALVRGVASNRQPLSETPSAPFPSLPRPNCIDGTTRGAKGLCVAEGRIVRCEGVLPTLWLEKHRGGASVYRVVAAVTMIFGIGFPWSSCARNRD
ncbi:hypothetical protein KM043_002983 [Ampulex compressa]|nr:hypothetical protein KM043_002983 [Ampulex compressa]